MSPQDQISQLLTWCNENGVDLDPRLEFTTDTVNGVGVKSCIDSDINPGETLVMIPRTAVLSVKSCFAFGIIPDIPYGIGAQLCLALALYVETLKGESSKWFGYLQSLPSGLVSIPLFWEYEDRSSGTEADNHRTQDGRDGIKWLRGTEVEKCLRGTWDDGMQPLESITYFYRQTALPLLRRIFDGLEGISVGGFYRAFSLVSSRAFLVDAYYGLSMVPVADIFNHVQDNHVHLQSDHEVCTTCGSLRECLHDRDDNSLDRTVPRMEAGEQSLPSGESTIEMVSNSVIPPHAEIFNTYGEHLTNAQLLSQYGFTLDVNENDCLTWTVQELVQCPELSTPPCLDLVAHAAVDISENNRLKDAFELLDASELVYLESDSGKFCINGDGRISHVLWTFLALCACAPSSLDLEHVAPILHNLADLQYRSVLWGSSSKEDGCARDDNLLPVLKKLIESVITLCVARRSNSGPAGYEHPFTLLDGLTADQIRTRLAMNTLLGELSILDSCEAAWSELSVSRSKEEW